MRYLIITMLCLVACGKTEQPVQSEPTVQNVPVSEPTVTVSEPTVTVSEPTVTEPTVSEPTATHIKYYGPTCIGFDSKKEALHEHTLRCPYCRAKHDMGASQILRAQRATRN